MEKQILKITELDVLTSEIILQLITDNPDYGIWFQEYIFLYRKLLQSSD